MEAWTITKYVSPYLAINDVRFDASTGEVLVVSDVDEYVIEHGDHLTGDVVAKQLESLRKPGSSSWQEVLSGAPDSEWYELLENMDYLGLLREAKNVAKERRDSDLGRVQAGIAKLVESVLAEVPAEQRERLVANVEVLGRHYSSLVWEIAREYPLRKSLPEVSHRAFSSVEILGLDNFYQQIAMIQGLYQRSNAPLSLICNAKAVFDLHTHLRGGQSQYPDLNELLAELSGGAYSAIDALRHLNGLAEILVSGADPARSKRYATASYEVKECISGIEFMLDAEKLACEVLRRVGTSEYLKTLEDPEAGLVLVHGRYLQDYRVTTRFPEIIAAILPKRLNDEMRAKAFRYYKEEVGHDVLEYESCIELGLSEEQIQNTEPLPLHFAYVDVFTQLGVIDPVAYTTSIFVTEGIIGVESPLDKAYRHIIGDFMALDKHILLNEKYHHTSIPRLFMAEVKSVSPAVQRLSIDYMLLMLELNYRAWDDLLDFYHRRDQRFFRVLPKPAAQAS
jgi:thiaminase